MFSAVFSPLGKFPKEARDLLVVLESQERGLCLWWWCLVLGAALYSVGAAGCTSACVFSWNPLRTFPCKDPMTDVQTQKCLVKCWECTGVCAWVCVHVCALCHGSAWSTARQGWLGWDREQGPMEVGGDGGGEAPGTGARHEAITSQRPAGESWGCQEDTSNDNGGAPLRPKRKLGLSLTLVFGAFPAFSEVVRDFILYSLFLLSGVCTSRKAARLFELRQTPRTSAAGRVVDRELHRPQLRVSKIRQMSSVSLII